MQLSLFTYPSSCSPWKVSLLALGLLTTTAHAQSRSSESDAAAITDPKMECSPYYYEPTGSKISSFPVIWQPASILSGDTVAQDRWNSISGNVPNISPKGTNDGEFSSTYASYPQDDPDCWWTAHQCVTPKLKGLPVDISSVPEPKTIGYGFDDGPNCSHNAFYDYLTEQNQKATMFYIGSNVMNWPLEAQRAVADGHEVCAHTWSHRYMTSFSSEDAFAELYYTMEAIKLVAGVTPTCWRPPFGDVDDRIRAIANGLGLRTIIWKYDSFDWRYSAGKITIEGVDQNYQKFIDSANSGAFDTQGAIILTHELNNFTMQEAIKWYPELQKAFSHIVPVGVALNITQPYVESDYSLPSFDDYVSGSRTTSGTNYDSPSSSISSPISSSSSSTTRSSSSAPSSSNATKMGQEASPNSAQATSCSTSQSMMILCALTLFTALL